MGIFDALTGDPAKDAAAQNTALLQANQTAGTTTLQNGQTQANAALTNAAGAYAPLTSLANQYQGGTNLYLDSLGVNGASGNTTATNAFQAAPGYQYSVDQSLDGVNRAGAATGVLAGGNTLAALSDRAGNMANQAYGTWQQNLSGVNNNNLTATGAAATGIAGADTNMANVDQSTANNIAGLGTTTATGIAGQNTQAANAAMAASGNVLGLGMNIAKLGLGAATGGTSLLGGSGGVGSNLGSLGVTYGQAGTPGSNLYGPVAP